MDRRSYLRRGALVGVTSVAGCLEEGTSDGAPGGEAADSRDSTEGHCGDGGTRTPAAGSPGECVPVVADGRVTLLDLGDVVCALRAADGRAPADQESFPDATCSRTRTSAPGVLLGLASVAQIYLYVFDFGPLGGLHPLGPV